MEKSERDLANVALGRRLGLELKTDSEETTLLEVAVLVINEPLRSKLGVDRRELHVLTRALTALSRAGYTELEDLKHLTPEMLKDKGQFGGNVVRLVAMGLIEGYKSEV